MKNTKFFFIILLAFLFRLIALNQSLWLDEAISAKVASKIPLSAIISRFSIHDFHPPLYYFFLRIWSLIFGISEISLRMPSVIFSLLTGYVVYKIVISISGKRNALWAALFFLLNPLIVYYSQEARMYMMATFFLSVATFYLLKLLKSKRQKSADILLFNIATVLSVFTFYGSVFMIAAFGLALILKKRTTIIPISFIGVVAALLILSPLLIMQYQNSQALLSIAPNWRSLLGVANAKNLILIPLKFATGRISMEPKIVFFAVAGLWTLYVAVGVAVGSLKSRLFFTLLSVPLALGFIFSLFTPLLSYFRFLYLILSMSCLLALGVQVRFFRQILIGGFVTFSLIYLLSTAYHREDWKSLSAQLPSSRPIYMISTSSDPIGYYRPDIAIIDLRSIDKIKPTASEIYIIPYTADIYGYDFVHALQTALYKRERIISYRGLSVELWSKSKSMARQK